MTASTIIEQLRSLEKVDSPGYTHLMADELLYQLLVNMNLHNIADAWWHVPKGEHHNQHPPHLDTSQPQTVDEETQPT